MIKTCENCKWFVAPCIDCAEEMDAKPKARWEKAPLVAVDWKDIRDNKPPEGVAVLFQEKWETDLYHVGYWNEDENAMTQFAPEDGEGWKWSVTFWTLIPPAPATRKD